MILQKDKIFKTDKWLGGTTTQLFIYPIDSEYVKRNFLFRLSSATIDLDKSEFSDLSGFQRFIALIEGELSISHDDINYRILALNEVYAFDGGVKTVSKGKCRDFNLMIRNHFEGSIQQVLLKKDDTLVINSSCKKLIWLFSFNNEGDIQINVNHQLREVTELEQMTLFVFTPERGDVNNEVVITTTQSSNLFYGKIKIVK